MAAYPHLDAVHGELIFARGGFAAEQRSLVLLAGELRLQDLDLRIDFTSSALNRARAPLHFLLADQQGGSLPGLLCNTSRASQHTFRPNIRFTQLDAPIG